MSIEDVIVEKNHHGYRAWLTTDGLRKMPRFSVRFAPFGWTDRDQLLKEGFRCTINAVKPKRGFLNGKTHIRFLKDRNVLTCKVDGYRREVQDIFHDLRLNLGDMSGVAISNRDHILGHAPTNAQELIKQQYFTIDGEVYARGDVEEAVRYMNGWKEHKRDLEKAIEEQEREFVIDGVSYHLDEMREAISVLEAKTVLNEITAGLTAQKALELFGFQELLDRHLANEEARLASVLKKQRVTKAKAKPVKPRVVRLPKAQRTILEKIEEELKRTG